MEPDPPSGSSVHRLVECCALAAGGLALFTWISWGLGSWRIAALGPAYIPMAPSTALLMFLLSMAVLLNNRWPSKRAAHLFGLAAVVLVALFSIAVCAQSLFGLALPMEQWLTSTTEKVGEIPVGRMSPVTALVFLLAAVGFLLELPPLSRRKLCRHLAAALPSAVVVVSAIILLGYAAGAPPLYGGQTVPMALLTAVSFALLGLAILGAAGPDTWLLRVFTGHHTMTPASPPPKLEWRLLTLFLAVAVGIGVTGVFYLKRQIADSRRQAHDQLSAIADLKVGQIVNWRMERRGDASYFFGTPFFASQVLGYLAQPSARDLPSEVLGRMAVMQQHDRYERVLLLDPELNLRLSFPPSPRPLDLATRQLAQESVRTRQILISDLYRDQAMGDVHLDIVTPLLLHGSPSGTPDLGFSFPLVAGVPPAGVLVFQVDPRKFLFPLIQSWPTPSRSAETLLVRREGNDMLYLSELRHRHGTALTLRLPLDRSGLPAALAVLGQEGVVEGNDYRNVPVLAALRTIPNSPWFMVAKVDQEEIYAPLRGRVWSVTIIAGLIASAACLGVALIWRWRDTEFLRRELASEHQRKTLAARAEEALRQSEALYHDLVETSQDLIWQCDAEGRYTYLNPAWQEVFGYKLQEMLGKRFHDFQTPEYAERDRREFARLMTGGSVKGYETVHRRKDGEEIHLVFNAKFLRDKEGRTCGTRGTAYDITERKRAAEALQFMRISLDNAADTMACIGRDGRFVDVNNAFCRIVGYSREELLSMTVHDIDPDYQAERWSGFWERLKQAGSLTFESLHRTKDGRVIPVEIVATFFEYDGREYHCSFARDITDRKRSEEALQRYSERLEIMREIDRAILAAQSPEEIARAALYRIRRLVACLRASVVVFDFQTHQGKVLATQVQAETTLDLGTVIPLEAFASPEQLARGEVFIIEDLAALPDPSPVLRTLRAEGMHCLMNVPLMAQDELIGVLNLAADHPGAFTPDDAHVAQELADVLAVAIQQTRLREEVQRYTVELEQRVVQRTAELQAKNKELETFTYSVSHDLKAPLRAIDGYSRLLMQDYADRLDDEGKYFVANIRAATERMSQLIDDLLSYSRLERRAFTSSSVRILPLIQALVAERSEESHARDVSLAVDVPDVAVTAESEGLAQALRNLLDNAFKFTRTVPHARIEIGAREMEKSRIIRVHDNGTGFDMKYHNRIFEIFQRLHRDEDYPGTGVGLAIVRKAMERLGGKVWAESAPGQGATFYVELPK